jgi:hypothetical protein
MSIEHCPDARTTNGKRRIKRSVFKKENSRQETLRAEIPAWQTNVLNEERAKERKKREEKGPVLTLRQQGGGKGQSPKLPKRLYLYD